MIREPDPLDAPLPDTLGSSFRAIRAFALPVAGMALLVCLDAFLRFSDRLAGEGQGFAGFATGLAVVIVSSVLGYGVSVFVLSDERISGWRAYTDTDPSNLRLYVILSVLFPVTVDLVLSASAFLPEALAAGIGIVARIGAVVLILTYGTLLPAAANGDPFDPDAARDRRQRFALFLRLFVIPLLGISMLSLVAILLGYVGLPGTLILIPVAPALTLWIVASHVALAKAYRGAYRYRTTRPNEDG